MFAGDAVLPGEVQWGTRYPMFAGDAIFHGVVYLESYTSYLST